jgi:hypothetical protein
MEIPMINWPTAFVIAVAMICGAFLINKPSDAAGSGGGDGDGTATPTAIWFVHAHKGQLRYCKQSGGDISCNGWTN